MNNVYPDVELMFLGDKQYKMDDWLQLLGMFIADGSTNKAGSIQISALKNRKIAFNTNMLTKLGIKYKYDNINDRFIIVRDPYPEVYEHLDKLSVGALNKYLPDYVWSLSKRQSIILLDALMQGDGHTYADGFSRYGTISPKLASDVCRLVTHCGWSGVTKIAAESGDSPHMIKGSGHNKDKFHLIESKNTYYKISIIRKQNQPYINKKVNDSNEEKLIDYEGKVYCIEMPSSHLYYMRENNFAPSMLLGNSRAGQKGTLGLIIPEDDMPFTEDGIRPDLIINPHALPSRMTIGQIIESLFGKVCTSYGAYGDCTAFQVKGPNYSTYAPLLVKSGFHSSGNQILYNGMSGQQLEADIYIGPTYYMRLKHMVKDKINYRARGPNTALTRQPVQGRANDGGLRIGEMERDGVLAHGMSYFLNESFMLRGEKQDYFIAICNKTGSIAIYNESRNLFLSPSADGPIKFNINPDGTQSIMNLSRFGRSFSILKVPYAFKLLIQELQIMNVQMRIITEENIDQLLSMSFSDNINKLMKSNEPTNQLITEINSNINGIIRESLRRDIIIQTPEISEIPEPVQLVSTPESPPYAPESPPYAPETPPESPPYAPESPPYAPESPPYAPESPPYAPESPPYAPETPPESPPYAPESPNEELNKKEIKLSSTILDAESPNEELNKKEIKLSSTILDGENQNEEKKLESSIDNAHISDSDTKIIIKEPPSSSSNITTSTGIKKITI
jgi:hypothetical protein